MNSIFSLILLASISVSHGNPSSQSQECTPGKHYCSSQLINMGYDISEPGSAKGYKCTQDKKAVLQLDCEHMGLTCAVNASNGLSCSCSNNPTKKMCGHELVAARMIPWPNPNVQLQALYKCSDPARPIEVCPGYCDGGECVAFVGKKNTAIPSRSSSGVSASAPTQCTPGKSYCGSQLRDIGYTDHWERGNALYVVLLNSIFQCSSNGTQAIAKGTCHILDMCDHEANPDQPRCHCGIFHSDKCGRTWLGHWSAYTSSSAQDIKLDGLYECSGNVTPKVKQICEFGCNPKTDQCETQQIGKKQRV